MEKEIAKRSKGLCEVCGTDASAIYTVDPKDTKDINGNVHLCSNCNDQLTGEKDIDANHWRCLNDAMWNEVDAVKVIAYRMLNQLKGEGWPVDLIEMMYLEDDVLSWAKEGVEDEDAVKHVDSNGVLLENGDAVVLIKDLKVKGGGFTAKRGTAVRNIKLVQDNPEHIEGKVEGQSIVILTQYVKK